MRLLYASCTLPARQVIVGYTERKCSALVMVTAAQDDGEIDPETETLLYLDFGASDGFVLAVTPTGSRFIDLSKNLYDGLIGDQWNTFSTSAVKLSPDGRLLAVGTRYTFEGQIIPHIRIAQVEEGTCCWYVDLPPGAIAYELAGFDPTSTRLALSYVTDGPPFEGGIVIMPVPFNEHSVATYLSMDEIAARLPELPFGVWAKLGEWDVDGIRFYPNCYACEGVFEGEYMIWNPDTDEFTAHSGEFFSSFGVRLDATGEMIVAAYDLDYPANPQEGMFPPSNVVRYSPSGDPYGPDSWVIYHDSETLDLQRVDWVLDGQAILVVPRSEYYWMLIHRNGTIQRVDYSPGNHFFAGTVDGWLALTGDEEGMSIFAHYDERGSETRREVATFGPGMDIRVLHRPMGGSLIEPVQPFRQVLPPDVVQCPGLLPSRLAAGQQGRVTPGTPNRMRDFPSLIGSNVVGEIPGGGEFSALQGPTCDAEAGIAWWRVQYGDLIGWTAESQGDTYFTEPAG